MNEFPPSGRADAGAHPGRSVCEASLIVTSLILASLAAPAGASDSHGDSCAADCGTLQVAFVATSHHELVFKNESFELVRIEFLDSPGPALRCGETLRKANGGREFSIEAGGTLPCLGDAGTYPVRIHQRLLKTPEGSLWAASSESIEVK